MSMYGQGVDIQNMDEPYVTFNPKAVVVSDDAKGPKAIAIRLGVQSIRGVGKGRQQTHHEGKNVECT